MTTTFAAPLLVPCTEGAPHAFGRLTDCPTCGGRGTRPADDVEYVYCDEGNHEHELRTDEQPPTLEGALQQFFQPAPATSSAPYEYSDRIHQPEWAVGPPHIGQREDCGPCNDYVERMRD